MKTKSKHKTKIKNNVVSIIRLKKLILSGLPRNTCLTKKKQIILLVLFLLLASIGTGLALNGYFGGGGTVSPDSLTRGLVGYWAFEEGYGQTAYDASGNGNNGTLYNGPKWTRGKVGGALEFDGTNDYIKLNGSTGITLNYHSFTISAWLKPDANPPSTQIWFSTSGGTGCSPSGDHSLHLRFYSTGVLRFGYYNDDLDTAAGVGQFGVWQHVVYSYDADTDTSKIYVNGIEKASGNQGPYTCSNPNIYIGAWGSSGEPWKGFIDEVRIYNRALSEAEVRYLYNRGGPIAHWKFDEGEGSTIYDSTDNDNDGTLNLGTGGNTDTSSFWVQGKFGTAGSFDGTDDYVEIPYSASLNPDEFTVEAWAKVEGGEGTYRSVITSRNAFLHRGYKIYAAANDKWQFWIGDGGSWRTIEGPSVQLNQWYHLVAWYSSGIMRFYINGTLVNSANYTLVKNSQYPLRIGAGASESTPPDYYFNGLIDDVRIYNYARTPEEIRLDYNAGLAAHFGPKSSCERDPGSCVTKGLVGYWAFEEGEGQTAYDASGNGNNGTLHNGPKWSQGKVGGALEFDGTDDYIDLNSHESTLLNPTFTISFWVKPISFNKDILGSEYVYKGFGIFTDSGGQIYLASSNGGVYKWATGEYIPNNSFSFITLIYTSNSQSLYINGEFKKSYSYPYATGSGKFAIGRASWGSFHQGYFSGLIDDVRHSPLEV